jgi:hypothetical protein
MARADGRQSRLDRLKAGPRPERAAPQGSWVTWGSWMTRGSWVMSGIGLLLIGLTLHAQQNVPHAGYVYPAGARQGDTVEVVVGGQFLDGVSTAMLSGSGVHASVAEFVKPLTMGQVNKLRDQLQELMEKKKAAKTTWTADDDKTVADLRKKISTFIRPMTPALAENVRVEIKLDPDAPLGERELRLVTPTGVTNPIVFCVGQLPETSKPPAPVASDVQRPRQFRVPPPPPPGPADITLPTIINGQITPGGLDRYRFTAAKGQHLVIAAAVRELIPYISDAVPGWFQAALGLYDSTGKEVTYADHYGFHQDPVMLYEIPANGQYTLQIHDSIYRGREDFVYRIAAGELPYVTSIFPLGGKAGLRTAVELKGWNLPSTHVTQDAKGKATGVYPVSVTKGAFSSNPMPFAVDTLPEILDREPNNTVATAQRIKLPLIINGRIDKPGDADVFRLDGRAGEEIVAEVVARRLDSPLDSILKLTDARGKQIAMNDDFEDKGAGLITHQADSFIQVKLPATGTYYLSIGDTQRKGGTEYAYRLRVSHPQPDFQLRMTPSSVSARGGLAVPVTVYALRKDGFNGEIELKLKDAPAGFALSGAWIPGNQSSVRLTLTLPPKKMDGPVELHLEGRSKIEGKDAVRVGVPAEDMMQAFASHHLVNEDSWMVRVGPPARGRNVWKVMNDKPVQVPLDGQAAPVKVFLPLGRFAADVQLVLNDPPEGIVIGRVGVSENGVNIFLRANGKAKAGLAGNLIVDAFMETENPNNAAAPKKRTALGLLPAISFSVCDKL